MGAIQQLMLGEVATALTYSTWNPSDETSAITLSNGNLTLTTTATANQGIRGTLAHASGKWYFEVTVGAAATTHRIGVADSTHALNVGLGYDADSVAYISTGSIFYNISATISVPTYTSGATISVAVDVTNHLVYFAQNGAWVNSAVPTSGTGGVNYVTTHAVFPAWSKAAAGVNSATLNVGATAFNYSPPTGFSAWD